MRIPLRGSTEPGAHQTMSTKPGADPLGRASMCELAGEREMEVVVNRELSEPSAHITGWRRKNWTVGRRSTSDRAEIDGAPPDGESTSLCNERRARVPGRARSPKATPTAGALLRHVRWRKLAAVCTPTAIHKPIAKPTTMSSSHHPSTGRIDLQTSAPGSTWVSPTPGSTHERPRTPAVPPCQRRPGRTRVHRPGRHLSPAGAARHRSSNRGDPALRSRGVSSRRGTGTTRLPPRD